MREQHTWQMFFFWDGLGWGDGCLEEKRVGGHYCDVMMCVSVVLS